MPNAGDATSDASTEEGEPATVAEGAAGGAGGGDGAPDTQAAASGAEAEVG